MKKVFLLSITCLFTLYLTGCANYVPEDTEHENIVPYDEFEKFLETKTENYYITTESNNNIVEYLVDGLFVKEVYSKTIQETVEYTDINNEESTIYAMYELNDDNYDKSLSKNIQYFVSLQLGKIYYNDFNLAGEVYKLKSHIDYGVEDLTVELNESTNLFEFKYTIGIEEYISTYKMTNDVIELPEYTYHVENVEAIKSFYNDYANATAFRADGYFMHSIYKNSYSNIKYATDDTYLQTTAILEYYDDRTFKLLALTGWDPDESLFPDYYLLYNIFRLEDEDTFMSRFENSIYDATDNSYTSIQNGNIMKYTFDFEEKTLTIYDGGTVLIADNMYATYYRLNDESLNIDLPNITYVNLIK